jgi:aspartate carbamoyltransferase regulatory subunit
VDKILFISGLRGKTGYSRQEVNLALTELIREKIITIEKENKIEIISYYTPQEIIEGKKDKPAELSEAELDDILHAKPIPSFPDILICKNCNCMTHDKKDFPNICAKCGKDRKGEITK